MGVEATLYCHLGFIPAPFPCPHALPSRTQWAEWWKHPSPPHPHLSKTHPGMTAMTRIKKGHVKRKYFMRINASLFSGVILFIITKNLIKATPLLWKWSSKPSPLDATSTWMAAQWPSCKAKLQPLRQSNCLQLQAQAHLCPTLNASPSLTVYALSCVPWLPIKQQ